MNERLFVERKEGLDVECQALKQEFKQTLNIDVKSMRYYLIYDIFNTTKEELAHTIYRVFTEKNKDIVSKSLTISSPYVAYEYLPGQYDLRADSAKQCYQLLCQNDDLEIKTGILLVFDETLTKDELKIIKTYLINPVESKEKDLEELTLYQAPYHIQSDTVDGFISLTESALMGLYHDLKLSMNFIDFQFIKQYFINKACNPYLLEIKVLDTYWSDHCRHTTFHTILENIAFKSKNNHMQATFHDYLQTKKALNQEDKPITLMDLATINMKWERHRGNLEDFDDSIENNAASLVIDIDVDHKKEPYLLMFKNETHNHPTEIEPYGGASTCLGGAIRDPLSGRSYVYGASRISGAGNILEPISKTLKGKLPQRTITKKAAEGYSSYGNQIGLATTFVQEIYHEGYKAKRMEVGAVIAACPKSHVRREIPQKDDLIVLIGGRTGKDGIGGATGSSKSHDKTSIHQASTEVQKGNPVIERKIQRLFRNPKCAELIKKSNDFGAGGVSVAIGEIADGVHIWLDKIPTKHQGMNPIELALSESQERMAVVIDAKDERKLIELAEAENLEATTVAVVLEDGVVRMSYQGDIVCKLNRDFIDTSGVRQRQDVLAIDRSAPDLFKSKYEGTDTKEKVIHLLQDLNIQSQQGLVEMFDNTIGLTTVVAPYGGKNQKTKAQASVQRIPVINGQTQTVSVMTHGFDPYLSEKNPYLGSMYAVIDSIAKSVASGSQFQTIRFTFQEYFEKLQKNKEKWGKPFMALLGAFHVQKAFGLAAIGGKDSMSGTFEDMHVPPTLISFAVSTTKINEVITNEFKQTNAYLYLVKHHIGDDDVPNSTGLMNNYKTIQELNKENKILSAYAIGFGGLVEAIIKASFGNKIGVKINTKEDVFTKQYGSILVETAEEINHENFIYLGKTTNKATLHINELVIGIDEALATNESKLADVFPVTHEDSRSLDLDPLPINYQPYNEQRKPKQEVNVLLPIFPGTNCEYDSEKAFKKAGATVKHFVFKNQTKQQIKDSIQALKKFIDETDILMLSGGFSSGDEPDGSGKFIANVLESELVKKAIQDLLKRKGLILGICNGFQALIKSGLLPYGEIVETQEDHPNLHKNSINRHVAKWIRTKVSSVSSPWLAGMENQTHFMAVSHGEGRFEIDDKEFNKLLSNNQIAFQYVDENNYPTYDPKFNPNGSKYAIEGIISKDGLILGKMGHSERLDKDLYVNLPPMHSQKIFENAVHFIKKGNGIYDITK